MPIYHSRDELVLIKRCVHLRVFGYRTKPQPTETNINKMNKLRFSKDEGSEFYKELNERIEKYFSEKGIHKTGNKTMIFKIILYFSLDILFYGFMITSTTTLAFYTFYLLMGLSVLLTAFNISHDAAHGVL